MDSVPPPLVCLGHLFFVDISMADSYSSHSSYTPPTLDGVGSYPPDEQQHQFHQPPSADYPYSRPGPGLDPSYGYAPQPLGGPSPSPHLDPNHLSSAPYQGATPERIHTSTAQANYRAPVYTADGYPAERTGDRVPENLSY